ncbi:MAG: hypothetical protein ACK4IY_07490, partial [Chitinophagales bacterium]
KPALSSSGERLSILLFGTLGFYYLASGILAFLDKKRITRTIRLIYLIGLWGVSISVIGIMCRILLLQGDKELLMAATFSLIGVLLFSWLSYRRLQDDHNREVFTWQMQPLVIRSIPAIMFSIGIIYADNEAVYKNFGTYRNNADYLHSIVQAYENPNDTAAVNAFKRMDEAIRSQKLIEE